MPTLMTLTLAISAVSALLIGGVYFAFSGFVMQALAQSGDDGPRVMTSINDVILGSTFMPLFFVSTILAAITGVFALPRLGAPAGWMMLAGSLIYVVGMFAVTVAFNVPLNNQLAQAPQTSWAPYLASWTAWNHLRTTASTLAGVLFIAALVQDGVSR